MKDNNRMFTFVLATSNAHFPCLKKPFLLLKPLRNVKRMKASKRITISNHTKLDKLSLLIDNSNNTFFVKWSSLLQSQIEINKS